MNLWNTSMKRHQDILYLNSIISTRIMNSMQMAYRIESYIVGSITLPINKMFPVESSCIKNTNG